MKKLTIDSRPLLAHNIRQVQLKLGQYQVFCQTTAEQVVEILCTKVFPSKIDWKYPKRRFKNTSAGTVDYKGGG